MKLIKTILFSISFLTILSAANANKILVDPDYEDLRFSVPNKYHAGCNNVFQVTLESIDDVKDVKLFFGYNQNDIKILRFMPDTSDTQEEVIEHKVEYYEIHFDKSSKDGLLKNKKLFRIEFKSNDNITGTVIHISSGSYITTSGGKRISLEQTFRIEFAPVPECRPDIVPPSVKLIQPKDKNDRLPLDAYFIFDIKDSDSGVNTGKAKIIFDGKTYDTKSSNVIRSGSNLIFFPEDRLAVKKDFKLEILVQDNQNYGGANITDEVFLFKSASGVSFNNYISPSKFRNIVYQTKESTIGTGDECETLKKLYIKSNDYFRPKFGSIINKLECPLPTQQEMAEYTQSGNTSKIQSGDTKTGIFIKNIKSAIGGNKNVILYIFAAIGWILVILLGILRFEYLKHYVNQKKDEYLSDKDGRTRKIFMNKKD